jgi:hypothetical protein
MDPQSTSSPDLRMPPPDSGSDAQTSEQGNALPTQPRFSDASDTVLVNPRDGSSSNEANPAQTTPALTTQLDNAGTAQTDDDDDSLDEEWIQKAKIIVDQTKADPYQQSREISKVKANYLKTHYNKDIKVADDQSL